MNMHNPPHPGEVLQGLYLEPLELTVTATAQALGVSRKTLSAIINGRASVTPDMALRFAKAFGGSAESWVNMQQSYDLWQARQRADLSEVKVLYEAARDRRPTH